MGALEEKVKSEKKNFFLEGKILEVLKKSAKSSRKRIRIGAKWRAFLVDIQYLF
jgi:hypothetical protein